ncbi:Apoptotic chromatin condensation inducer in the nucleus [Aphelenchoides bicaudatus]|nr:Apoptotic chromatin condensation inducer in the nucleus [Aphelenchoides bicaudatus]
MSTDPVLDGQPISLLKVVDLRKELDRFGLSKAGNKKDLGQTNDADPDASRPSTRSSASPQKGASPTKTPAKSQSPAKAPAVNRFVAQYLQSQQASLEENKREAELRATSTEKAEPPQAEETPEKIEEAVESMKSPEKIEAEKTPVKEQKSPEKARTSSPTKKTSPVKEVIEKPPIVEQAPPVKEVVEKPPIVEQAPSIATLNSIPEAIVPRAERDEVSSTVSNAGSESAPQTIDDTSSIEEGKSADEPKKKSQVTENNIKSPVNNKKEVPIRDETVTEPIAELKSKTSPSKKTEAKQELPIVVSVDEPTGVELDYEEDEPAQVPKSPSSVAKEEIKEETAVDNQTNEPTESAEPSTPPETAKKHRAIVFDLGGDKSSRKSSDTPTAALTKTTISIRPTIAARPSNETSEHGTNSLGNVRVRPVSPSSNEATQYIHISQLKRPYVVARLQAVLRTFGEFSDEDFWIDELRANCMVKYDSVEAATKAREEMHQIKWPDVPEAPMIIADFVTEEKFQRKRGDSSSRVSRNTNGEKSGFIIHVSNERKSVDEKTDSGSVKSDDSRKRKASPRPKNNKPLDELFKATKTKPMIYYLPLTEEQIAAKKQRRKL